MSLGKYSPTVSMWYAHDREWYEKNGGGCIVYDIHGNIVDYLIYDKDGYDRYGYHMDTEQDRAGYTELDYLEDSNNYYSNTGREGSPLYQFVSQEYSNKPVPTCEGVQKHKQDWSVVKAT